MKFLSLVSFHVFGLIIYFLADPVENLANFDGADSTSDLNGVLGNLDELDPDHFKWPITDFIIEDDFEDFDLSEILSLSERSIDDDIDKYSNLEKMEFVDLHNIYRSNLTKPLPKGSNVHYVEWNNTLEWAADDYLKNCIWAHGWGKHDNMTDAQGQNLYLGPAASPSRPMFLWYEEYKWYNFSNFTCAKPYTCGHVTQILWYNSQHIGCARKSYCFPKQSWKKIVNCHYYPAGNILNPGLQVYKYGWPCTRCHHEDGNLCYRNLCVDKRMCSEYNLDCECKLACKNCAKPNPRTCLCDTCKSGWDWEDCSYPCVNAYDVTHKTPGACERATVFKDDPENCEKEQYREQCRKRCGACRSINLTDKAGLCCDGKMCPMYYILDEKCQCKMDCPSPLCLFPPSTTTKHPAVLNSETKLDLRVEINSTIAPDRNKTRVLSRGCRRTLRDVFHLVYLAIMLMFLNTLL